MNEINLSINNCMDCNKHLVENDPDPYDSFNSDDVAVLCQLTENTENVSHFAPSLGLFQFKPITVSCRPYNKRKECDIPNWCPCIKK